ncbi:hypothetical protein HRR83_001716 [Exophiala dermatitidis]|uniref:Uncharacterized protein n=1 Tax=Exophiala dermatitidis TaxID=5970 RepID=A0AAN6F066_EXODE|nr:hypothetical protein HRR73_004850 [Exophiala dermatitidis]KAJ4526522.1 hypothetical protein HRR74_001720 [Exophiala dermatitidis]KAJ4532231.1 hypothetical protein HRR76_007230 [Exophiala dermatitidis]KAJ4546267.1 hypothetical protein HRR77_004803 [Exophiala dermatitidis]KAJ4567489.1 hypothetical protein HRR79_005003 [Exophiala dermatitidis]
MSFASSAANVYCPSSDMAAREMSIWQRLLQLFFLHHPPPPPAAPCRAAKAIPFGDGWSIHKEDTHSPSLAAIMVSAQGHPFSPILQSQSRAATDCWQVPIIPINPRPHVKGPRKRKAPARIVFTGDPRNLTSDQIIHAINQPSQKQSQTLHDPALGTADQDKAG